MNHHCAVVDIGTAGVGGIFRGKLDGWLGALEWRHGWCLAVWVWLAVPKQVQWLLHTQRMNPRGYFSS